MLKISKSNLTLDSYGTAMQKSVKTMDYQHKRSSCLVFFVKQLAVASRELLQP